MKRLISHSLWIFVLFSAWTCGSVQAKQRPVTVQEPSGTFAQPAPGKAATDTIYILGGADRQDGRFQDDLDSTVPDSEGWMSITEWESTFPRWNIDTVNAELLDPGQLDNHAMWCGTYFIDCPSDTANPGYGNNWDVSLQWQRTVGVPQDSVHARITAWINYDTEPGYDYLYLQVSRGDDWFTLREFNSNNRVGGVFVPEFVDETVMLAPEDYVDDQVIFRWRFHSDGAFSDEDCHWPTVGAAQIDKISVIFDQGTGAVLMSYDNFEDPQNVNWINVHSGCSIGKVWPQLADAGLAHSNQTPQIAFVDDGTACDFSDGTPGVRWTYGPGGFVPYCKPVPDYNDQMYSPALVLPADIDDYDGARLEFDVYKHAETSTPNYTWAVRIRYDDGTAWRRWQDHRAVYEMRDPAYSRESFVIDPFILEGADQVQISLGYYVHPFFGPIDCDEIAPAPYFDNVALKVFKRDGPHLYTTTFDSHHRLLQDAFPANGALDLQDLGANSVPMVAAISNPVVQVQARARDGAQLTGPPELHWRLKRNPLFDPYRTVTPPNPVLGDSVGTAHPADPRDGVEYAFAFPDSGWFFPGDIFHYYFEARDDRAFGTGLTQLPADTTGYSTFAGDPGFTSDPYHPYYIVRALPSLTDTIPGAQPKILVWQDYDRGPEDSYWHHALASLGFFPGVDYDLYQGTYPNADFMSTAAQMSGYESLLYSANDDPGGLINSSDIYVLEDWIAQGMKNLLLMGDNLADDLGKEGGGTTFLYDFLGVSFEHEDIRPHIDGQTIPLIEARSSNTPGVTAAFKVNATLKYNDFDAIVPFGTAERLFDYANPAGQTGGYPYAAGVYHHYAAEDAHLITLPFGLEFVVDANGDNESGQAARTQLLGEILTFFGSPGPGGTADVPMARELTVSSYPNPFNPSTTIAYSLPSSGHLEVKLYDLRGRLVRTLHDQQTAAGRGEVVWDGTDARGSAVSSGVYFCRVTAGNQERLLKLSTIK